MNLLWEPLLYSSVRTWQLSFKTWYQNNFRLTEELQVQSKKAPIFLHPDSSGFNISLSLSHTCTHKHTFSLFLNHVTTSFRPDSTSPLNIFMCISLNEDTSRGWEINTDTTLSFKEPIQICFATCLENVFSGLQAQDFHTLWLVAMFLLPPPVWNCSSVILSTMSLRV